MERGDTPLVQACRRLEALVQALRAPDGCPWDRAQTLRSLSPYLIEEIHELYEAIAQGDRQRVAEEAGDALFLLIFALRVAEHEGWLHGAEVAQRAEEKLVRRHPHVFGEGADTDRAAPMSRWEQIKRGERPADLEILGRLPAGLPALARAARLQEKAAAFGFDWKQAAEVVPKLREEIEEVHEAVISGSGPGPEGDRVREEIGDLLFAVVNLARHLGQDPEATLHAATEKFRIRFNTMARSVERAGYRMGEVPLEVMEAHWQAGKGRGHEEPEPPSQGEPDSPALGDRQ